MSTRWRWIHILRIQYILLYNIWVLAMLGIDTPVQTASVYSKRKKKRSFLRMQVFIHSFINSFVMCLKFLQFFHQYRERYLHLAATWKGSSGQTGILCRATERNVNPYLVGKAQKVHWFQTCIEWSGWLNDSRLD